MASFIDKALIKKSKTLNGQLSVHTKKIDSVLLSTFTNPKRSAAYWKSKEVQIAKIYSDMNNTYEKWVFNNLPVAYRRSAILEGKKIKKTVAAYGKTPKKPMVDFVTGQYSNSVISALVDDSVRDFTRASSLGQKNINRYLSGARKTSNNLWLAGQDVTGNAIMSAMSADPTFKKLIKNIMNSQYMQIIDKNGNPRNYTNKYYAEMVNRSKWHEAQSAAVRGVAHNYNTDLIRVSAHNTTTVICQQYEGKVMSLSGKEPGFPIADNVPPYHTNCIHFITVVFIETLRATGTEQGFKDFGSGESNKPPFPDTYVPVSDREAA